MAFGGNPTLNDSAMDRIRNQAGAALAGGARGATRAQDPGEAAQRRSTTMTVSGSAFKCLMMLGIVLVTASITWGMMMDAISQSQQGTGGGSTLLPILMWGGAIGGFIVAIVTVFKPNFSPITAPIYAALEGLFLGGISAVFEQQFSANQSGLEGIVFQAVLLTLSIAATMFALYGLRIIKVTEKLKAGIMIATFGVMAMYLVSFVLMLFGMPVSFLHSSSPLSIGISGVIVVIAAFNLLLDFDFIENGEKQGLPKWAEWYGAFGLMVTLIWLYIEVLRLLAKLRSR